MEKLAPGSQLAQMSLGVTTATTLFTATLNTEITRIQCVNYTGSAVDVEVYHDDDGTTYNNTTIIGKVSALANQSTELLYRNGGQGISVRKQGSVGVKAATSNSITVTAYGVTEVAR